MEFVAKYGIYRIWHLPRKRIYRISRQDKPQLMLYLNHKQDFKSIDEIIEALKPMPSRYNYTDPYNVAIQWLNKEENKNNENYKEIELLVRQYYYGISAKKELKNKLNSMGIVTT